jgi:hypothetical protein
LGTAEKADEIKISWPSGKEQVLKDIDAGQIIKVEEPD